jgi:predicted permease
LLAILTITAPIYLVVAAGWVCTRGGLFARTDMRVFGKYVVNLALPALLFNALAQRRIEEVLNPVFLGAYLAGSLAMLLGGIVWARRFGGMRLSRSAIVGMGMACPNSSFIGFPVVLQLLGQTNAAIALALALVVENFVLLPLAIAIAEADLGPDAAGGSSMQQLRRAFLQSARGVLRNPIIWGVALGALFATFDWRLPDPLARSVDLFAQAAASLALFVIGGSLVGIRVRGMVRDVTVVAVGKLLLHPLAVLLAVLLLPATDRGLQAAAVVMAAVPMLGIYPILAQKHGHDTEAAAAQLATTVASFFTLTALVWAVQRFVLA